MEFEYSDFSEIRDRIETYSLEGNYLGVKNRGIVHDEGLLHYAIHCWVWGYFNERLTVVFQKRKNTKRIFPGKYDVAAAGHYLTGEYGSDGLRELTEELKIPISYYDITYYKTVNCQYYDSSISNNELCNVYLCKANFELTDLKFDCEEIEDLILCDVKECLLLLNGESEEITVYSLNQQKNISITSTDFIEIYKIYFKNLLNEISERNGLHNIIKKRYYSFIMFKPDAIERNLVTDIISFLLDKGIRIELFDIKIALDEKIYLHYADKIAEEGNAYKIKAYKYFHDKYVIPMVISHDKKNTIEYIREIIGYKDPRLAGKDTIRGMWGIDSMQCSEAENRCCENLIHASDSVESLKKECFIWFKRKYVEKFFM